MKTSLFEQYGPWALITGASSGLGEEFAKQLAQHGFHLLLAARRVERLSRLAEQLESRYHIQTRVIGVDLADAHFMDQIAPVLNEAEVGLLINNAGFSSTGEFLSEDILKHEQLLRVNCYAPMLLCHALGRQMSERGQGGIINVSSSVAFFPAPYWTHYAAAKSYSMFLGEGLSYELKAKGIDVLAICPGGMKTEFQEVAGIQNSGAMQVAPIVKSALRNLGKRSVLVPGLQMRFLFYDLPRILPRKLWISFMANLIKRLKK